MSSAPFPILDGVILRDPSQAIRFVPNVEPESWSRFVVRIHAPRWRCAAQNDSIIEWIDETSVQIFTLVTTNGTPVLSIFEHDGRTETRVDLVYLDGSLVTRKSQEQEQPAAPLWREEDLVPPITAYK